MMAGLTISDVTRAAAHTACGSMNRTSSTAAQHSRTARLARHPQTHPQPRPPTSMLVRASSRLCLWPWAVGALPATTTSSYSSSSVAA